MIRPVDFNLADREPDPDLAPGFVTIPLPERYGLFPLGPAGQGHVHDVAAACGHECPPVLNAVIVISLTSLAFSLNPLMTGV